MGAAADGERAPTSGAEAAGSPLLHRAARIEDSWRETRERYALRRGFRRTVVAHTGYGSRSWIRILARVVLTRKGRIAGEENRNVRGWRSFLHVPVDAVEVSVRFQDEDHTVFADRGGVVDAVIEGDFHPGRLEVELLSGDSRVVTATVVIAEPEARLGIVSDVDDTVMVTALPRPLLAAWNTFVLNEHARTPVAGMAVLYDRLKRVHGEAPIFYLSTGAWNVAPTLGRFLSRNLYPFGPLLLTDWGPTEDRWFRSGREHKRRSLERLAAEFPEVEWLLIGDDGQHDEQIYGDFAAAHPGHVAAVAIRELSPSEAVWAGGRSRASDSHANGVPWVYAPDGAGLAEQLARLGLLG